MRKKAGMKAEPSCNRHAILPVSLTITLAQKPKKIPDVSAETPSTDVPLTGNDPKLPEHDQGSSDPGRGELGREDGDRGVLGTDSNAHDETNGEERFPGFGETGGNRSGSQAGSSDEDLSSSTEVVVKRVRDESTAACQQEAARLYASTHMQPAVKKMIELMAPTIHSPRAVPTRPNSAGNDKLAPFDPVWSHPAGQNQSRGC